MNKVNLSMRKAYRVFCAIGLLHAGCGSANKQRVSKPPEFVRIEWEYASNRGGLMVDQYNTIYSINGKEVGWDHVGVARILNEIRIHRNAEIQINVWPTIDVGPTEVLPDLLTHNLQEIISISRENDNTVIFDPSTKPSPPEPIGHPPWSNPDDHGQ